MLSMSVQPIMKGALTSNCPAFVSNTALSVSFKTTFSVNQTPPSSLHLVSNPQLKTKPTRKLQKLHVAAEELAPSETTDNLELLAEEPEKIEVKATVGKKPRLVLKFIWMEKNIGLGLDQIIPGHGSVPLSPYFFWPRKDAWEEPKATLESKPWISQKKMIILLNQATDIINLWQQSGGNLS